MKGWIDYEDDLIQLSKVELIKIRPENVEFIFKGKCNKYKILYCTFDAISNQLEGFILITRILKEKEGYIKDIDVPLGIPIDTICNIYSYRNERVIQFDNDMRFVVKETYDELKQKIKEQSE